MKKTEQDLNENIKVQDRAEEVEPLKVKMARLRKLLKPQTPTQASFVTGEVNAGKIKD